MNPTRNRSTIIYLLLFVVIIIMVVYNFQQQATSKEVLPINQVAADNKSGVIERILENDNQLRVIYSDGTKRSSHKDATNTLVDQLIALGVTSEELSADRVDIEINPRSAWLGVATALGYLLPFVIVAGVFWFVFRQAQARSESGRPGSAGPSG